MGMPQEPAAYNAGVGYPVDEEILGNLAVKDPSGTGRYGIITAAQITTLGAPTGQMSGFKDTAGLAAAISRLNGGPGLIVAAAGNYYLQPGQVTALQQNGAIFIMGAGEGTTRFYVVGGGGDGIRMYNPNAPAGGFTSLTVYGGGVLDVTFDASLASAGTSGLHIGDGEHYQVRCQFEHFNQAGDNALVIDNSVWWTEKGEWDCIFVDCISCVLHKVSGTGTPSHAENNFRWTFFLKPNQNAIIMQGISHYLGKLECRGVFNQGVSNTGVWLTMDATSSINNCEFDVALNLGASGAAPTTMALTTGFTIQSCHGRLIFNGGWNPGNVDWTGNTLAVNFAGDVLGDTSIHPASAFSTAPQQASFFLAGSPLLYAKAFLRASDGHVNDMCGDFFTVVLTGSITIGLGGSGSRGSCPGPQRKTFIIQQAAAGGPFTVTWPHNAVPTPSAPKVIWAGGVAPTMTAAAGATDMYELSTIDGATWIGRATQNVS